MLGHHCLNGIPEVPGNMSAGFTGFTPIKGKTLFMTTRMTVAAACCDVQVTSKGIRSRWLFVGRRGVAEQLL
jgi:hypothetical protein